MLVSRLLRFFFGFLFIGIVPDGGGAAAVPETPDPTPPATQDAADPAPADPGPAADPAPQSAEQSDPAAALRGLLDRVGQDPTSGQPRDAQGRFAAAQAGAPATPAATAQAPTPTPAPVVKTPAAPGELDLTPPEGLSDRARERFTQMAERIRTIPQLEQRATEAQAGLDSVRQLVSDSGLQPQEFTEMLDMARAFRSNSPQDLQRALQYIDGMRTDLALRLGVDAPAADPLAAFPDLQQKVQGMLLTREDALELARLRKVGQQHQSLTQEQQQQQQFRSTVQSAAQTMDAALRQRAGEPGHDAKVRAIGAYFADPAKLQAFVNTYEPRQWQGALMFMYDNLAAPAPAPVAAAPAGPQPLRPGNTRTGPAAASGPVTAQSALEQAFAAAGM